MSESRAADQKFCFSCGRTLHVSAHQCPGCGASQPTAQSSTLARVEGTGGGGVATRDLPSGHVFCRGCGSPIHETALVCPKCGAPQSATQGPTGGASSGRRTTAAVLALLLGGLGAHKFYLGRVGQGIVYLFFCWTFIPAVIGLFEGISYLAMSDERFELRFP